MKTKPNIIDKLVNSVIKLFVCFSVVLGSAYMLYAFEFNVSVTKKHKPLDNKFFKGIGKLAKNGYNVYKFVK